MARQVYTEEYKRNALDLVKLNGSLKGTARELGIDDRTLRRWARQYEKPTSASGLKRVEAMEKDEIIRSQDKKIRELERKVFFLTETMAFFAKRETSDVSIYRATPLSGLEFGGNLQDVSSELQWLLQVA